MIPVNEPLLDGNELKYVSEAVKTGWISSEGRFIRDFEEAFARYTGRRHAVTVDNGTNALILAVRALGLPPGSEVILPSFTIISCALACVYNDLVPVFVDAEPETWNLDAARLEEKITGRTRAIMPVHIYGHPADMGAVEKIAAAKGLKIIEDFAEAIGSEYSGKKCGGFGDVSCASFYANKVITTGEGGMCLTDDDALALKLRQLKNLAFIPEKRFLHHELGYNFRMTNVSAAIGLAQLESVEDHVQKKVRTGRAYTGLLKPLADRGLIRLPVEKPWARNTYWMYGVVLEKAAGMTAEEAMAKLAALGIQTRPFFHPMHDQPVFERFPWFKAQSLPVSENLYKYGFYLPSGLALTDNQLEQAAAGLKEVLPHGV